MSDLVRPIEGGRHEIIRGRTAAGARRKSRTRGGPAAGAAKYRISAGAPMRWSRTSKREDLNPLEEAGGVQP